VIDEPFDPSKIVTPDLPVFVTGELHQELGRIQDLGGSAFLSSNVGRAIGDLAPDRFALLNFRALQPAENSPLKMKQGGSRIVTVPTSTLRSAALYFEPQTITVLPSVTGSEEAVVHPALVVEETPAEVTGELARIYDPPPILASPGESSVTVSEPDLLQPSEVLVIATLQVRPAGRQQSSSATTPDVKWHNPQNPMDVDGTGRVRPVDVLIIANYLNVDRGNWELPAVQFSPPRYLDVNGDGRCHASRCAAGRQPYRIAENAGSRRRSRAAAR
jgi:hypothetical protein